MDANSLTRFAQACGAVRPLDLLIERPNGSIASNSSLTQPYAVIGSDPYCDIPLPGSGLAPRHLIIQVVMGRAFVFDISGQPQGLTINGVPRADGFLKVGESIVLSGHRLYLTGPVAPPIADPASNFHPLVPHPDVVGRFAKSQIEFRNGRTAHSRWDVNRVLTFVGRAKACKINLTSEDVSLFHCYFLLTNDGLWVVDAFGRGGISVNGMPQRFYRLGSGDDLAITRFHLGVGYPNGDPGEPVVPLATALPPSAPTTDDSDWLTSSGRGHVGTGQTPPPAAAPNTPLPGASPIESTPTPHVEMPKDLVLTGAAPPGDPSIAVTGQMFEQFQQSMLLMMKMFGQMHQQQMAGLQQEMARLASLTDEIGKMQSAIQKAVVPAAPVPHVNHLPDPDAVPAVNDESAKQHEQIFDKMARLEAERQSIWKRLASVFGPNPMSA